MNELSIIVPCVSTTETLYQFLDQLALQVMDRPSDIDVIVVTNETVVAPEAIVSYVRERHPWLRLVVLQRRGAMRNFGALVRFGVAYSTSRSVVIVSPYGEDDLSLITRMLDTMRKGAQVVQATRYASPEAARSVSWLFRFYQSAYRFLTRALLGLSITDSTYGFKMFDRVFVQALGLTHNGYSVCPEITLKALLAGGRVEYLTSMAKTTPLNKDFKIWREGMGYLWVLVRGSLHRVGIVWF
ncbi:MAG: glycosyltransferase [bacterium]|nr:glycosyltransferase [bacterium]